MSYVIGLDIGTQSSKAILLDTTNGKILKHASAPHSLNTPKALWAEQEAEWWFESTYSTLEKIMSDCPVNSSDIKAIGISGLYGGSGVPVDEHITPIAPCLIWMDRRAEQETLWVKNNIDSQKLFQITGNSCNSYFGFTKILWIKHNLPDVWKNTKYFLPPSSYVIYKLTGEIAIDHSSAGNIGGVYDIKNHTWSDELIKELGIEKNIFPRRLVEGNEPVGYLSEEMKKKLNFSSDVAVMSTGVDAPVSLLATGILKEQQYVAMMGTSTCLGFLHSENNFPTSTELVSMPFVLDGKNITYTFGGASTSGAITTWFINNFFEERPENIFDILETFLLDTPAGAEGLITLPYFAGERSPIWDAYASGCFFGLGLYHSKKHIYRSILESAAFSLTHNMELVHNQNFNNTLIVVGGASKSKGFLQIISDITQMPVSVIKEDIEAPLGSSILAALGVELIEDISKAHAWMTIEAVCTPNEKNVPVYEKLFTQYKAIYNNTKTSMYEVKRL